MKRNEAVDILKEVLESADIICPDAFILDGAIDSQDFKVRIKTNERDKSTVKEFATGLGLAVNEEIGTGTLIIS